MDPLSFLFGFPSRPKGCDSFVCSHFVSTNKLAISTNIFCSNENKGNGTRKRITVTVADMKFVKQKRKIKYCTRKIHEKATS